MTDERTPKALLAEQIAYYRAVARDYERYAIDEPGADEIARAFETFRPSGHVLELACGPGMWTERLLEHAASVTAVDAAPEMIARARARVGDRARFVLADLFEWQPDRRYDAVFFGFWLSHVPLDRFDAFWSMIADSLVAGGQVMFVDDNHRTSEELIEGAQSSTVQRRLHDGTAFRAVKVAYLPTELEARLRTLGWQMRVHATPGPFYWGLGSRP